MKRRSFAGRIPAALLAFIAFIALVLPDEALSDPRFSRRQVEAALAQEPEIEQVQGAALEAGGYERGKLDRWSTRARWSNLMPKVRGEVAWLDQHDLKARYYEDMEGDENGALSRDKARNNFFDENRLRTLYAIDLTWDLSGLIYDRSESTIAREVRQRRQAQSKLLEQVSEAYYQRRRALLEWMLTPEERWRERLELELEVERHTAHLDAMTAGWFTRELERARQGGR